MATYGCFSGIDGGLVPGAGDGGPLGIHVGVARHNGVGAEIER